MEADKIRYADVLDIIFEGKNKEYGAYELRKTYNKRMTVAIVGTLAVLLLAVGAYVLGNSIKPDDSAVKMNVNDIQLEDIKQEQPKQEEPPPPPPPKPPEPPKVEMAKYTPPKIVKDEEVKEDEKPPEVDKLEDVKIAVVNQEGIKDMGIVAPPVETHGTGVVEAPKKVEEDWDRTFTKVEIESSYPGGPQAWLRFLNRTLRYPPEAQDNEIEGQVVIQFVVDKEGNVSEVEAISGPEELRAEAVRVIKRSGKWTPAVQNGRQVKSIKKQPILFKMS
ncbi:energy transducer TonB [Gynurincola endophyticus]|jgi:protein TonB|uniref:energy transducer TonB n=1 Tax=Gynurincola endophyticus TaxID=2479004 RepID=UPI000F8EA8C7|nr:energy transducer TonB [Gynurincola endophyticus]